MNGKDYLAKFHGLSVLVAGDLMLDEYVYGQATRVSQEAPVLVVKQSKVSSVPGGAANVAMNLMALGASTGIIGVAGQDKAGDDLEDSLKISGINPILIQRDSTRPTTRKTRVVANHSHQVLRIDHEDDRPIPESIAEQLIAQVEANSKGRQVILLSDYQKGAIPQTVIEQIIALGRRIGLPVVANAKPGTLSYYSGAAMVSLNRFEASAAVGSAKPIGDEQAGPVAKMLRQQYDIDNLVVTLGGSGMVVATKDSVAQVPAVRVEVYDEAGAGDTVIATLALCAALGPLTETSLHLATHTAASVVRKPGVAVPSTDDLEQIGRILG
ncbi:MAG: hypothetical protein CBB60_004460 [Armatimonadetes bacterium Cent15-Ar3]|jgi:rfaE bifunctional protein kinase chain/domain|nr:MAG: hypothetical protein CBB60_004460 [Armatimonadetes bacterium Cent15-Ar3]